MRYKNAKDIEDCLIKSIYFFVNICIEKCCSVIDSYFTNIINKDIAKHKFIKDGKSAFDRSIYKKGDGKKLTRLHFFIFIYSLFKVDKKHTLRYFLQ